MAIPGVGTVIMTHQSYESTVVDIPAIVIATHDSWNSHIGDWYGITQPASGNVAWATLSVVSNLQGESSPGTGSGQFSLLTTEVPDV
jgi:hypothetical protein